MISFFKKYFFPGKSILFYAITLSFAALFCLTGYYSQMQYRSLNISFHLNSQQNVTFDIYYDVGKGLTEKDRQSREIEQINQDIVVSFCIPVYHRLRLLRFDPAREFVEMSIKKIEYSYDSAQINTIPLESVLPIHQIQTHSISSEGLSFKTEINGDDPGFVINHDLSPPDKSSTEKTIYYLKLLLYSIIISLIFRFLYLFFIKGIQKSTTRQQ